MKYWICVRILELNTQYQYVFMNTLIHYFNIEEERIYFDDDENDDGETTRVIYELYDGNQFFREQMRGNVVLYN
jgi:hypothetical protein